jgi:hypothetical protein
MAAVDVRVSASVSDLPVEAAVQSESVLPVDPGFSVEAHVVHRFVKGEDLAFQYRADSSLLGRPMPPYQSGNPDEWKLNYDVFVVCDGHSGVKVLFLPHVTPDQ